MQVAVHYGLHRGKVTAAGSASPFLVAPISPDCQISPSEESRRDTFEAAHSFREVVVQQPRSACLSVPIAVVLLLPQLLSAQEEVLSGVLSSFGYGYQVSIWINGLALTQIDGGDSEGLRIFSSEHPMKSRMPPEAPEEVKSIFCLERGENRIRISFERLEPVRPLEVKIEIPDLSDEPVFRLVSETSESADAEFVFEIAEEPSKQSAVEIGDEDLER